MEYINSHFISSCRKNLLQVSSEMYRNLKNYIFQGKFRSNEFPRNSTIFPACLSEIVVVSLFVCLFIGSAIPLNYVSVAEHGGVLL